MPPVTPITTPAPVNTPPVAGTNVSSDARVYAGAPPVAPAAPGTDPDTGITADQFKLAPGESVDAYNTRIAGLRAAAGMPTPKTNASGAPTDVTSAEDQVAQGLGFKSYADAVSSLTAPPTKSESDLYNSAYSAAGLDQLSNTIAGKQNDLATAQGKINDNPWLDEASRVGRNRTLTQLATADIKNYQTEYTNKLKEVHDLVTRETADGTATTTANKAKLAALENQAKALAAEAATQTKTDNAAPKTIKGATGQTYQWNPTTQTFEQILPGKNPTPKGTDPTKIVAAFTKDLTNRTTLNTAKTREQFIRQLQAKYPNIKPDDISKKVYETYPDHYDGK